MSYSEYKHTATMADPGGGAGGGGTGAPATEFQTFVPFNMLYNEVYMTKKLRKYVRDF